MSCFARAARPASAGNSVESRAAALPNAVAIAPRPGRARRCSRVYESNVRTVALTPALSQRAREKQREQEADYATGFSSTPMPSISMRTTSPAFRYFGGVKPMPTPTGVPVAMTSPG